MKKIILFLFVIGFSLVGCKDKNQDIIDKGQLDPNAMIILRPAKGVQLRSTVSGLTALDVVQQAVNIKWQTHYSGNLYYDDIQTIARSFIESQKDYEIPALKMLSVDVITQEGEYYRDLTYAFNVVITDNNNDTIAYVPDAIINAVRSQIEVAFNDENYTEVYRLFDEAITFLPISE
jgi:hypothetical protein